MSAPPTLAFPLLLAAAMACQAPLRAQQTCGDPSALRRVALDAIQQVPLLNGVALRVDQGAQTVFDDYVGTANATTALPIASVTKTLSAAVLLSLVDDGTLTLDDTLGQWLPEYAGGPLAAITLRQCFAHTSGLPSNDPAVGDRSLTLRNAARQLASLQPLAAPGTVFRYGGVSMQIAGAVCEVAAGTPWGLLFRNRIAVPLGLGSTNYAGLGVTLNPQVGGGAQANRDDLAVFFAMLRNHGVHNGQQILSQAAVDLMFADQTTGAAVASTPHPRGAPYGLGIWLERQDAHGRTTLAVAAGAFGCAGWVDRARDASGVWLVLNSYQQMDPYVLRCYDVLDQALAPLGARCLGAGSPACAAPFGLNAATWCLDGQQDFGMRIDGAPAGVLGALVWSSGPASAGVPFLDLTAYVNVAQTDGVTFATGAGGNAAVLLPLPTGLTGATFAMQAALVDPTPCGSSGLRASRGVELTVR